MLPLLPRSSVTLLCCALWQPYIQCSLSAKWIGSCVKTVETVSLPYLELTDNLAIHSYVTFGPVGFVSHPESLQVSHLSLFINNLGLHSDVHRQKYSPCGFSSKTLARYPHSPQCPAHWRLCAPGLPTHRQRVWDVGCLRRSHSSLSLSHLSSSLKNIKICSDFRGFCHDLLVVPDLYDCLQWNTIEDIPKIVCFS